MKQNRSPLEQHKERYVMFSRKDGKHPAFYNLHKDSEMRNDVAGKHLDVAQRMFEDHVLEDAGGPAASVLAHLASATIE
jgi:hypothetical protein